MFVDELKIGDLVSRYQDIGYATQVGYSSFYYL